MLLEPRQGGGRLGVALVPVGLIYHELERFAQGARSFRSARRS